MKVRIVGLIVSLLGVFIASGLFLYFEYEALFDKETAELGLKPHAHLYAGLAMLLAGWQIACSLYWAYRIKVKL